MLPKSASALPDLIIESISKVKPSYYVGESMPDFVLNVKNIGDMNIASMPDGGKEIKVTLESCSYLFKGYTSNCRQTFAAGASQYSPYISGVAQNEVIQIRWPLLWPGMPTNQFQEGEYHLKFQVKTGEQEASSNNNYYDLLIPVNYPGIDSYAITTEGVDYTGPCPQNHITIAKAKIIATHGSGYIDYKWVSSFAGENEHVYSRAFANKEIFETSMVSVAQHNLEGWVQIKGLSPYPVMSDKAYFKITCTNDDLKKKLKIIPKKDIKLIPQSGQ
jgi:hypothetical protein